MENISFSNIFKKKSLILFVKIFIPPLLFLVIMKVFSLSSDINLGVLAREPLKLKYGEPFFGIISNIRIIIWCATSAILLFSARISSERKRPEQQTLFFFFSGLLSLLLLLDDFFMLHDSIFPYFFNIDEIFFYSFYALSIIALFYFYHELILNSDYVFFIFAFILLALSGVFDFASEHGYKLLNYSLGLIQEWLKFLGVIAWFAYFIRTSHKYIILHDQ